MTIRTAWIYLILPLLALAGPMGESPRADTVLLKNGRRYYNVKTVTRGDVLYIIFKSGRLTTVKSALVKRREIRGVRWKTRRPRLDAAKISNIVRESIARELAVRDARAQKRRAAEARLKAAAEKRRIKDRDSFSFRNLVPGLVYYQRGNYPRAAVYGGGAVFLGLYYLSYRSRHARSQRDYNDGIAPSAVLVSGSVSDSALGSVILFNERRSQAEHLERRTNILALLWLGLWGAGIWESTTIAPTAKSPPDGKSALRGGAGQFRLAAGTNKVGFSWEVRF